MAPCELLRQRRRQPVATVCDRLEWMSFSKGVRSGFRGCVVAAALMALACLSGCKSAYIQASIHNATGERVTLVEVDYPSASFGTEALAPGADFNYRLQVLGSGATKVLWTDAEHRSHTVAGPELHEGEAGSVVITLADGTAQWDAHVQ